MKRSQFISLAAHIFVICLLVFPLGKVPAPKPSPRAREVFRLVLPAWPKIEQTVFAGGRGGGPVHLLPASQGRLPRMEPKPLLPPMPRPETNSKLEIEPAVELSVKVEPALQKLPQLGSPWATPGPPSAGNGTKGYLGDGDGGPVGPGKGKGPVGPGDGSGFLEVSKCGPPVRPVILHKVEPEFSEDARRAKLQGAILIKAMVTESGIVREPTVQRGLGLGLDEKAIEAVSKWRFKPGMKNCRPTAMPAFFEVNFRLL